MFVLAKSLNTQTGAVWKRAVLLVAVSVLLALMVPEVAFAASVTQTGNSATINGYTITTGSTASTNPTWFTASSYARSSRQAGVGALRAKTQLRVGISTPYDLTVSSSWSYNKSETTYVVASATHRFTSNPGWGGIQATGTGGIYLSGWHDLYPGTATAGINGRSTTLDALRERASQRVDSKTGEVYLHAVGESGRVGYIKQGEESIVEYMYPQEAIAFIEGQSDVVHINLYDEDLTTVIDTYPVSYSLY